MPVKKKLFIFISAEIPEPIICIIRKMANGIGKVGYPLDTSYHKM